MMRKQKTIWLLAVVFLVSLAACGGNATEAPTQDPNAVITQLMQTVVVAQTQTALAVSPTPSLTPTPEMTNTPLISNTPEITAATNTPFTLPTAATTPQAGCDNFTFISDVTIPDGTVITRDTDFVKTWRVMNDGPCTWNSNYRLIWGWGGDGTNWATESPILFGVEVLPGNTLDISITLHAPADAGNYTGVFRLQNDNGYNFGTTLTVVIEVK